MNKITIEEIKWMCDKADGFEWENECNAVVTPNGGMVHWEVFVIVDLSNYPLLLQRAIEGVNRERTFRIVQDAFDITVYFDNGFTYKVFCIRGRDTKMDEGQAKLSALRYSREQEKKECL